MAIDSNIPQIVALRQSVERQFGKQLTIHADFVSLSAVIDMKLRQHISESTIERVWGYSTRGYATVSLRTLDVLSHYAEGCCWQSFCARLAEETNCESEIFDMECIPSSTLHIGDRLRLCWLPNRLCIIRYQGDSHFIAEHCENSKIAKGNTFLCPQFILGKPVVMSDLRDNDTLIAQTYIAGQRHGLTHLSLLPSDSSQSIER